MYPSYVLLIMRGCIAYVVRRSFAAYRITSAHREERIARSRNANFLPFHSMPWIWSAVFLTAAQNSSSLPGISARLQNVDWVYITIEVSINNAMLL
jgi:hypothetical protein